MHKSAANKIANKLHQDAGALTSRHVSKSGLKRGRKKAKRALNKRANRVDARLHIRSESE
jgi:hypothetical protein